MRLGKDAMFRSLDMDLADALEYLHAQLTIAVSTEDIVEGVTAFFEKREPRWKGRWAGTSRGLRRGRSVRSPMSVRPRT